MELSSTEEAAPADFTDCSICLSTIEDPRALVCLHTFCLHCLQGLYAKQTTENQDEVIKCPICCEDTPLQQPQGIDGLRSNFLMSALIEKRRPHLPCTGCEKEGRTAVGRCIECKDFLCQKCWESHKEMRVFQSHKVCTVDEIRSGDVEGYSEKHTGEVLWFYCNTCGMEHLHANHDFIAILKSDNDDELETKENGNQLSTLSANNNKMSSCRRKDAGIWLQQREFGKDGLGQLQRGAGIAICPSGDIVVADKNASEVKIYNGDGVYKHSLNSKQDHRKSVMKKATSLPTSCATNRQQTYEVPSSPHNIVVNANSDYFLTDMSHFVKVFDAQGMYKYHFPSVSTQNNTSESNDIPLEGLALDGEGNILVGANGNTDWYISRHQQDGTHVDTVNVRIRPSYLSTILDGKIVISSQKGVQILDRTGQLLHSLHAPPGVSLWNTAGVCTTKGIIFVANYLGDSMAIYCFSVTGKYLGCATREVRSPKGLAITDEGKKLLVVNNNGKSVKEFVLKQLQ